MGIKLENVAHAKVLLNDGRDYQVLSTTIDNQRAITLVAFELSTNSSSKPKFEIDVQAILHSVAKHHMNIELEGKIKVTMRDILDGQIFSFSPAREMTVIYNRANCYGHYFTLNEVSFTCHEFFVSDDLAQEIKALEDSDKVRPEY